MRARIAAAAARIMAEDGIDNFALAKRKAARSLGAQAEKVDGVTALSAALKKALRAKRTSVIVIDTDARRGTAEGGAWWDVAVTEAPRSSGQKQARGAYERARKKQALGA